MAGTTLNPSTKTCHHFPTEKLWFHIKLSNCFSIEILWYVPIGTHGYLQVPRVRRYNLYVSIEESWQVKP